MHLNEDILTLMTVRYGGASEQITLEGFICLVMRLKCMASKLELLFLMKIVVRQFSVLRFWILDCYINCKYRNMETLVYCTIP